MTPSLRKKMGNAAIKLAKSVGYENAGTIEFLVDQGRHFYFMEMNTRIQVEHTITEEVYACDLVKEQIRIAAGEPLSQHVARAVPRLHAIQCRINAEDPAKDFQPTPGRINFYYAPGGRGVRIDSHVYTGYTLPPYYASLIAKLVDRAGTLHEITSRSSTPLIVNDYAEIAARIPVEGVHVGQDDDSIAIAREKAGRSLLVGKSTHSLEQARAAQHEGADYIGF